MIELAQIGQPGVIENRATLGAWRAAGPGRWEVEQACAVVGAARPLVLQLDERGYVTCHCTAVRRALPWSKAKLSALAYSLDQRQSSRLLPSHTRASSNSPFAFSAVCSPSRTSRLISQCPRMSRETMRQVAHLVSDDLPAGKKEMLEPARLVRHIQ